MWQKHENKVFSKRGRRVNDDSAYDIIQLRITRKTTVQKHCNKNKHTKTNKTKTKKVAEI